MVTVGVVGGVEEVSRGGWYCNWRPLPWKMMIIEVMIEIGMTKMVIAKMTEMQNNETESSPYPRQ